MVIAAALALVASMTSAIANTLATVSGKIISNYDSSPIVGATIDFVDTTSSADSSTTTGSDGTYSIQVPVGTYDITFAQAGGYNPTSLSNHGVSSDTTLDEALVPAPPAAHSISGVVTDSSGNPASGAVFSVSQNGTTTSDTTRADGTYSVSAPCENGCTLRLRYGNVVNNYVNYDSHNGFTASSNRVINFQFPVLHPETVQAVDSSNNPMPGVVLGDPKYGYFADGVFSIGGAQFDLYDVLPSVTTDSNGEAVVYGVTDAGAYGENLNAVPPDGNGYQATSFAVSTFDGGTYTLNMTPLPVKHTFSGVVTDGTGNPVSGAVFSVFSGLQQATSTTGSDGTYSVSMACQAGCLLRLQVRGHLQDAVRYDTNGGYKTDTDTTLNFAIPTAKAETVHVEGPDGSPISGVTVGDPRWGYSSFFTPQVGGISWSATESFDPVTTGSGGDAVIYGVDGSSVNLQATPSSNSPYATANFAVSTFDNSTYDLTLAALPIPHAISGVVQDSSGNPIAAAVMSVSDNATSQTYTATTDANGAYSVSAPCETGCFLRLKSGNATDRYIQYDGNGAFTATTDVVHNYTFPQLYPETVHVVGTGGKPIQGVTLGDPKYGNVAYKTPVLDGQKYDVYEVYPATVTDGNGDAVVYGFNDPFWGVNIVATPPAGSSYTRTSFGFTKFDGGTYVLRFVGGDSTPPTVSGVASPQPNADGWNNTDVTVNWSATDDSGSASQPASTTISTEGANQTATSDKSCDGSGNCATGTVTGINIDKTQPVITYSLSAQPNAAGWDNSAVTVTFNCSDALSGVKSCPDAVTIGEGAGQVVSRTAVDKAGNKATTSVTLNADKTAPTAGTPSWTSNPMPVGGSTTLTSSPSDGLSGVVGGEYFVGSDPGVGNGKPMSFTNGKLTASVGVNLGVGVYSIGVRSQDAAGNWSSVASSMLVVYDPNTSLGLTGKNKKDLVPSLAAGDKLPGLTSNSQTDAADYGMTVQYKGGALDPKNDFIFTYNTGTNCNKGGGTNCHTFTVNATSFAWLVLNGTNNSRGQFQGSASATVDGVTTTNPFTVSAVDGDRLVPPSNDQLVLKVFAPGADPATATPIYQATGSMAKGNAVTIK